MGGREGEEGGSWFTITLQPHIIKLYTKSTCSTTRDFITSDGFGKG